MAVLVTTDDKYITQLEELMKEIEKLRQRVAWLEAQQPSMQELYGEEFNYRDWLGLTDEG